MYNNNLIIFYKNGPRVNLDEDSHIIKVQIILFFKVSFMTK